MIRRLQKSNREFAIVLRTMGIDSHNFLDTIRPMFDGKHKDFRDLAPMHINTSVGHMRRTSEDQFELEMDNQVFRNDEAIYEKLNSLQGINAIRDDFAYWQSHDYSCYAAKPLWIDLNDERHHHIIFDDNIRLDAVDDCIVNIRLKNATTSRFESIDFESYKIFEKSSILQPNLIKLLNPHLRLDSTKNHYHEMIRKSEKVYGELLENRDKLKILTKGDDDDNDEEEEEKEKSGLIKPDVNNNTAAANNNNNNHSVTKPGRTEMSEISQLNALNEKKFKNIKLNRSFSIKLEEAEKQIDKEDKTFSGLCVIN
jgi:hypothetical protein